MKTTINNPCGNDRLFTSAGPHYCFIHGRWGPHSADLPHVPPPPLLSANLYTTPVSQPWWYRNRGTTKLPPPARITTKLRGNFVTIEEIGAALFFAFMAGACLTGLYFDLINKAHPCDPVPCVQIPPPPPPPYRFRQFH